MDPRLKSGEGKYLTGLLNELTTADEESEDASDPIDDVNDCKFQLILINQLLTNKLGFEVKTLTNSCCSSFMSLVSWSLRLASLSIRNLFRFQMNETFEKF